MSNENNLPELEDNTWSSLDTTASQLAIGTKLTNSNGIILEKVSDEIWEYQTDANKISYNNRSIDCFKSIDSITFNVETN
jgi:hypothetical protein